MNRRQEAAQAAEAAAADSGTMHTLKSMSEGIDSTAVGCYAFFERFSS